MKNYLTYKIIKVPLSIVLLMEFGMENFLRSTISLSTRPILQKICERLLLKL
nr:hypothetical protein [uncultured bacterium]